MDNSGLKNTGFYKILHCAFTKHNVSQARFEASGNSMYPFIRDRDTIMLHSTAKIGVIKVGDIVAVGDRKTNQLLFVHRVIRIDARLCQTKGDNNQKNDGWVPVTDIIGVATRIKRGPGKTWPCKRWQNVIIAMASRYCLLNYLITPVFSFLGKRLKFYKTWV